MMCIRNKQINEIKLAVSNKGINNKTENKHNIWIRRRIWKTPKNILDLPMRDLSL